MRKDIQKILDTLTEYRKARNYFIPDNQTVVLDRRQSRRKDVYVPLHLIDENEKHFYELGRILWTWHSMWNVGVRNAAPEISGSMDYELNTLLPIFDKAPPEMVSGRPMNFYEDFTLDRLRLLTSKNIAFLKRHISEDGLELIRTAQEKLPNALELLAVAAESDGMLDKYGYEALKQAIWYDPHADVDLLYWKRMISCVTVLKKLGVPSSVLIQNSGGDGRIMRESVIKYLDPDVRRYPLPENVVKKLNKLLT